MIVDRLADSKLEVQTMASNSLAGILKGNQAIHAEPNCEATLAVPEKSTQWRCRVRAGIVEVLMSSSWIISNVEQKGMAYAWLSKSTDLCVKPRQYQKF